MPTPHAAASSGVGCDLSWTAGMPVHPEPAAPRARRLARKELREMVVLAAVCVFSTIVCVPPLAGVMWSAPARPHLVARDLRVDAALAPSVRPSAISPARIAMRPVALLAAREVPRMIERRPLAARLGRAIAGDGRVRVQPFPRVSEF
jgi:hypothetical protein